MATQAEQTAKFRALHTDILVLPNAWDAASARMVEALGAKAVATSSAAVAWSHGYADGEAIPMATLMASIEETLRVTTVPVTVDSEMGYAETAEGAAAHVARLIAMGVAGINIEDSTASPDLLAAKIKAIRDKNRAGGGDIFINARCDVYLKNLVPDDAKLAEAIRRGKLYAEAGADGFFLPSCNDIAAVEAVVHAVKLPFNALVQKTLPPTAALKAAGVRRVSAGAAISRAAYGAGVRAAERLLDDGEYDAIFASSGDCPDFNAFFA